MQHTRFRVQSRKHSMRHLMLFFMLAVGLFAFFELYTLVVPFRSFNPLWHEVTIGQPVIEDWRYGGQDAEGYLKFYNKDHTALLPPNSRFFDANGRFVVIERFTPSSVTYAEPYEAIPFRWFAAAVLAVGAIAAFVSLLVVKNRKPLRLKASKRAFDKPSASLVRTPTRRKRFRSVKRGKWPVHKR